MRSRAARRPSSASSPAATPTSSAYRCSRRRSFCAAPTGCARDRARPLRVQPRRGPGRGGARRRTAGLRDLAPRRAGRRRRPASGPCDGARSGARRRLRGCGRGRRVPAGYRRRQGRHRGHRAGRTRHPGSAGRKGPAADRSPVPDRLPACPATARAPAPLVRRGPGAVDRLAAHYPDAPVWVDDAALATTLRSTLGARLRCGPGCSTTPCAARSRRWRTPSMCCRAARGCRSTRRRRWWRSTRIPATAAGSAHMAVNRALLPALARQIRLRNLSGAILVDLAGLPVRRRAALGPALAGHWRRTRRALDCLGSPRWGWRRSCVPRVHPPLHELLAGPHAAGLAALRAVAAAVAARPAGCRHCAPPPAWRARWSRTRRRLRTLRGGRGAA